MALGEDPTRPGLLDTPRRFADAWREFVEYDPGRCDVTFEAMRTDQLVVVTGLRVWSLCEHHLMPFHADVSIGVIAKDRVLGLSKYARIAHWHAHRLQMQERLVHGIADELERVTGTGDVAVIARGRHLCMEARGIRTSGAMVTAVMRGVFRERAEARAEFLSLVGHGQS